MDFTREPIIESVVTPKEGCKLVVRSSKGAGQEEYFVDALEIVSFGETFFLRCLERPKAFLLPATDYEVLEIREPRMVIKGVATAKGQKPQEKQQQKESEPSAEEKPTDKKRERRRQRKKRTKDDKDDHSEKQETEKVKSGNIVDESEVVTPPKSIIPPPSTLISETISRYRGDDLFKGVFFPEEEVEDSGSAVSEVMANIDEEQESNS